jgi:D-glucosaminate PTS system EIID component
MKKLDKADLRKGWLKWAMFHLSSMSFEKLEAHGFAHSMIPIIKKLYKDNPEEQKEALKRHSVFYNTEPQVGSVVNGVVASLEEERANGQPITDEMFHSIKTGLMGPVAGIGDSTIQGIIIPILLTIGMSISNNGSPLGVLFYIVAYLAVMGMLSYWLYFRGYHLGTNALDGLMGANADRIRNALNVLGTMVIGGLAASSVKLATTVKIPNGEEFIELQKTLDGFFPGLLSLIAVLISWYLISIKKISATKVLLFLVALSIVGVLVGLF